MPPRDRRPRVAACGCSTGTGTRSDSVYRCELHEQVYTRQLAELRRRRDLVHNARGRLT